MELLISLMHLWLVNIWTLASLLLLGSISFPLTKTFPWLVRVLSALIFGLFLAVSTGYVSSYYGFGLSRFFPLLLVVGMATSIFLLWRVYQKRNLKSVRDVVRTSIHKADMKTLGACLAVSQIPILVPFVFFTRSQHHLAAFTRGNNDIGAYVIESEAMLRSGFHNSGFLANQDFFSFASRNDYGAPSTISWVSAVNHINPWEAVTPVICLVALLIGLCLSIIVEEVFGNKSISTIAICVLAVCNPPILYLFAHVFLSQLLSMSILGAIGVLVFFFDSSKEKSLLKGSILLGGFWAASFYVYAHMFFIELIFLLSGILASWIFIKSGLRKRYSKVESGQQLSIRIGSLLKLLPLSVVFGTLFVLPFLKFGVTHALDIAKMNSGWPLPSTPSLGNLFVVGDFNFPGAAILSFLSAVLLVLVLGTLIFKSLLREPHNSSPHVSYTLYAILFPTFAWLATGLVLGFSSYKSWKLMYFFIPYVLGFIFFGANSTKKLFGFNRERIVYVVCGLYIAGIWTTWGPLVLQSENYSRLTTSSDLYALHTQMRHFGLRDINIGLNPYFESMLAAAIVPSQVVHISSVTYSPPLTDSSTCTLIRRDQRSQFASTAQSIIINGTYEILNFPSVCDGAAVSAPTIALGNLITFNKPQASTDGGGWSIPEPWGIWSQSKTTNLFLDIGKGSLKDLVLRLDSQAFVAPNHNSLEVDVLANTFQIGSLNYTLSKSRTTKNFNVPAKIFADGSGRLTLTFVIHSPASPQSLGVSTDGRNLGIGLISLKLDVVGTSNPSPKSSK